MTPPLTPTLTATPDPALARARIVVTANDPSATLVTLVRTTSAVGDALVRAIYQAPLLDGEFVGYDWEVPLGQPVTYYAVTENAAGELSPNSNLVTLTVKTTQAWLRVVQAPSYAIPIQVEIIPSLDFEGRVGTHSVIGRAAPVVIIDVLSAATFTMNVLVLSLQDQVALRDILAPGYVLLYQAQKPADGNIYFVVTKASLERFGPNAWIATKRLTLDCVQTSVPVLTYNPVQYGWDYNVVITDNATYQALRTAYTTYRNIVLHEPVVVPAGRSYFAQLANRELVT